ncbi:AsmA family protein [Desulfovibrio aminophilus]|nr:AsmA family protein [Desulfovibrio aminophilus]MCM0756225.1 AsmA family protein [Desulfovibrio aminophilus]
MTVFLRVLRILIAILLFLGVLAGGGLFLLSNHLDSPAFRERLAAELRTLTGRPVRLDGKLRVTLFPVLGVEAEHIVLGSPEDFGEEPFVTADRLVVGLGLRPLWERRLDLSTVAVDGLSVNLVRLPGGRGNWEDWGTPAAPAESAAPAVTDAQSVVAALPAFVVRGLAVSRAVLRFDDRESGEAVVLNGLSLRTGAFSLGQPVAFSLMADLDWEGMGLDAHAQLSGKMNTDFESEDGSLFQGAVLQLDVAGGPLPKGSRAVLLADLDFDYRQGALALHDFRMKTLGLQLAGSVSGTHLYDAPKLTGHFEVKPFNPRAFLERNFPELKPRRGDTLKNASFSAEIAGDASSVALTDMVLVLDDTRVTGSLTQKGFAHPRYEYDLSANVVDLERYSGLWEEKAGDRKAAPAAKGEAAVAAGAPVVLLLKHHVQGRLAVSAFRAPGIQASDCQLESTTGDGRLRSELKTAKMLGGAVSATLTAQSRKNAGVSDLLLTASLRGADIDLARVPCLTEPRSWRLNGKGSVTANLELPLADLSRAPTVREILAGLKAEVGLSTQAGSLTLAGKGPAEKYDFSAADVTLRLAPTPQPAPGEGLSANTDLSLRVARASPRQTAEGRVQGLVLLPKSGGVRLSGAATRLALSSVFGRGEEVRADLSGQTDLDSAAETLAVRGLKAQGMGLGLTADLAGTKVFSDNFTFTGTAEFRQFNMRRVLKLFRLPQPNTADPGVLDELTGTTGFSFTANGVTCSDMKLSMDDTPLTGRVSVTDFTSPRIAFSVQAGALDLDRYLSPRRRQDGPGGGKGGVSGGRAKAHPEPLPLAALRSLNAEGDAGFKSFKAYDITLTNVKLGLKAANGDVRLKPLSGGFYGGRLDGGLTLKADPKSLAASLVLDAREFQCGAFLQDALRKEYLRGPANLALNLTSFGATDTDLLRNLAGTVKLGMGEGSYRLFGLGTGTDTAARTTFSSLGASFAVQRGVFSTDDFAMRGSLVSATGKGHFSLAEETIEMIINATLVATPNVPIRVYGDLYDPSFALPPVKLLNNTVQDILGIPAKSLKLLKDLF